MKKFLSMILALALVMSLGTVAFAAGVTGGPEANATGEDIESVTPDDNTATLNVQLNATGITDKALTPTYNVTVKWESLDFTYTGTAPSGWDPDTHAYRSAASGSWAPAKADITVTNHSDVDVNVQGKYTEGNTDTMKGAKFTFTGLTESDTKLDAGTLTNLNSPSGNQVVATLTATNPPTENVSGIDAGDIVITISAVTG